MGMMNDGTPEETFDNSAEYDGTEEFAEDNVPEGDEEYVEGAEETEEDTSEVPQEYAGKFKTPQDLARAYTEAESLLGRQGQELGQLRNMVTQLMAQQQMQLQNQQQVEPEEDEEDILAKMVSNPKEYERQLKQNLMQELKQQTQREDAYVQTTETSINNALNKLQAMPQFSDEVKTAMAEVVETDPLLSHMVDNVITAENFDQFNTDEYFENVMTLAYYVALGKNSAGIKTQARREAKGEYLEKNRLVTTQPKARGKAGATSSLSSMKQSLRGIDVV